MTFEREESGDLALAQRPGRGRQAAAREAPPTKAAAARPAAVAVTDPGTGEQLLGGKGAAFRRISSRKAER